MKRAAGSMLTIALVWAFAVSAAAAVPDFVTYSGRLTDGTAWGESASLDLTFRIYDCGCEPGDQCAKPCVTWPGTPLHQQTFTNAPVEDGYFSVILTGVANTFAAHDQTWITACIGQACGPEFNMVPRQPVGSVPYAMRATLAARAEMLANSRRISATAVYRGSTTAQSNVINKGSFDAAGRTKGHIRYPAPGGDEVEGYPAAKLACEAAMNSSSAHMCTSEEMVFSFQMALPVPDELWFSGATRDRYYTSSGKWANTSDCRGWRVEEMEVGGNYWYGWYIVDKELSNSSCDKLHAVACCDYPAN